jgi:glutaredoxin 2
MTLFTKDNCEKCDYVKQNCDLNALGVKVEVLGPENPDALAHLAWHGLVGVAEKLLPILVLDDSSHIAGALNIKKYLAELPG